MPRRICLEIPLGPASSGFMVPGMGTVQIPKPFQAGYDVCAEAHAWMQNLQPIFAGLGMPLCILGCLTSVTEVFSSDFPYVNPSALAKIPQKCLCLASFTPFGFCGLLKGIIMGAASVMNCMVGLLGDVLRLEAQVASLMTNPDTVFMAQCLQGQSQAMLKNVMNSFGPIAQLLNSTGFLFSFVGVAFTPVTSLAGDNVGQVLQSLGVIQGTLNTLLVAINAVCPG